METFADFFIVSNRDSIGAMLGVLIGRSENGVDPSFRRSRASEGESVNTIDILVTAINLVCINANLLCCQTSELLELVVFPNSFLGPVTLLAYRL